jgi:hypothetical protein
MPGLRRMSGAWRAAVEPPRSQEALHLGLDFGEIWQGKGLTYDLASAAFCQSPN